MPEGDTVWRTARRMNAALAGRRLERSDFRIPTLATADLSGQTVTEVAPRGKHLLTRLDSGLTLHTHFRLEGSWHLYAPGAPWGGGPAWQIRVILTTADRVAVGYRLPVVDLLPTAREDEVVGHLGPDVLGPSWDLDAALRGLRAEPARPVGAALLDQRVLAGLGNIWRTEACFLAGVSPWTPVVAVPDLRGLVRRAQAMISAGARGGHQVTTGSTRRGEEHWVYGRAGRACRRCGTRILVAEQGRSGGLDGSEARITAWCPVCQPGPGPAPGEAGGPSAGRGAVSRTGQRRPGSEGGGGSGGSSFGRISSGRRRGAWPDLG